MPSSASFSACPNRVAALWSPMASTAKSSARSTRVTPTTPSAAPRRLGDAGFSSIDIAARNRGWYCWAESSGLTQSPSEQITSRPAAPDSADKAQAAPRRETGRRKRGAEGGTTRALGLAVLAATQGPA
jgi:hypothetical protein